MINIKEHLDSTKAFTVPVSAIKPESHDHFKINGKIIPITSQAFKDILKISGVTSKMLQHLNETLDGKAGFAIVNQLIKALGEKQGMRVKILIDVEENKIIRIAMAGDNLGKSVPAQTFTDLINYLSDNKKVIITGQNVTDGGTKMVMSLKWDKPIPLAMKGEDISYGKEITWDMFGDVDIRDFVERQVCTNGMTGFVTSGHSKLGAGSSPSDWYNQLVKALNNPDVKMLKEYERLVFEAQQTNLSLNEFNQVKSHAITHWKSDAPRIVRYLGDERWKADYKARGIDIEKLNKEQLKNCPTPVNKWDAVNLLTDLASHDYVSNVSSGVKIKTQNLAGKFLRKGADEDRFVVNVPTFNRSTPGNF